MLPWPEKTLNRWSLLATLRTLLEGLVPRSVPSGSLDEETLREIQKSLEAAKSHGDSLGWAAQLVPLLLLGLVAGCVSHPGSACLVGLVGFAVLCNSVAGGAGHATEDKWRPLPEVLAEARDWIDEQPAVMSESPVNGRLRWPGVSGAEASLFAALVSTSLWANISRRRRTSPSTKSSLDISLSVLFCLSTWSCSALRN